MKGTAIDWLKVLIVPVAVVLMLSIRAAGHKTFEIERKLIWLLVISVALVAAMAVVKSFLPLQLIVESRPERIISPVLVIASLLLFVHIFSTLRWWKSAIAIIAVGIGLFQKEIASMFPYDVSPSLFTLILLLMSLTIVAILLVRSRRLTTTCSFSSFTNPTRFPRLS